MRKSPYLFTVFSLYINYIFQGMAAIILSLNMSNLMSQMQTDKTGLSFVISAIGLGRIIILYPAGRLSDRYGRKQIVYLGMLCYLVFFSGLLMSTNIWTAAFFTLFAGFANALLDTGTYPALTEAYPEANSAISVLNKAFISVGQFFLPIMVRFITDQQFYFGYAFLFCFIGVALNGVLLLKRPFADKQTTTGKSKEETVYIEKPNFAIEGWMLLLFGFTSVSTFNITVIWLPEYALTFTTMSEGNTMMLVSLYSIGSFVSVFLTAFLVKKWVKDSTMMLVCSLISFALLVLVLLFPTSLTCMLAAVGIGLFAAGGIWQLGLAQLLAFFPKNKGRMTSYYTLLTSFSVMLVPMITGYLSEMNMGLVFLFNAVITLLGAGLSVCIAYRHRKLTNTSKLASFSIE